MNTGIIELLVQAGGVGLGLAGLGTAVYTIQKLLNHLQHVNEAFTEMAAQMKQVAYALDLILRKE